MLNGLRILNTRPKHQALQLSQAIEDAGGTAVNLPTLVIEPLSVDDWGRQLPALDTVQIAIFVSVNAVQYFFAGLAKMGLEWPAKITVLAIGNATAAALAQYHQNPCHQPLVADSEHLLALESLQEVAQHTLLLIAGENGRSLLATTLRARGALVYNLAVYKRLLPVKNKAIARTIWQADAVDIILLLSQQAIANLFVLFGAEAKAWIESKPCVVISPRLAATAYRFGLHQVTITPYSDLINTLAGMQIRKYPMSHSKNTIQFTCIGLAIGSIVTMLGWGYQQQAQDLKQLHKKLQELTTIQQRFAQELSGHQTELHNLLAKKIDLPHDWQIQKARYYLELAQITAAWTDNIQTTQTLLRQAAQLLSNISDPALEVVREALAQDLLHNNTSFDPSTLLSRLDSLSQEIQALENPLPPVANRSGSFSSQVSHALQKLQALVIVHHYPVSIKPTTGLIVQESILFNIQQAQRALIARQASVYQDALHKIANALQQRFSSDDPKIQALLLEIQKLQDIPDLRPISITALPLINAALVQKADTL